MNKNRPNVEVKYKALLLSIEKIATFPISESRESSLTLPSVGKVG